MHEGLWQGFEGAQTVGILFVPFRTSSFSKRPLVSRYLSSGSLRALVLIVDWGPCWLLCSGFTSHRSSLSR